MHQSAQSVWEHWKIFSAAVFFWMLQMCCQFCLHLGIQGILFPRTPTWKQKRSVQMLWTSFLVVTALSGSWMAQCNLNTCILNWVFLCASCFRMLLLCFKNLEINLSVLYKFLTLVECFVTKYNSRAAQSACGSISLVFCRAEGGRRHGYMGHLTRIANCIVHSTDKGPNSTLVQQLIKGNLNVLCLSVCEFQHRSFRKLIKLKLEGRFWIKKIDIFLTHSA